MYKKLIISFILMFSVVFISGCAKEEIKNEPEISPEEQEFNDSGRVKAILDIDELQPHFVKELQGKWVSVDDLDSVIEFKDDKKIDYYADQFMSEDVFYVYGIEFLTVGEGDDKLEYKIVELAEETLTLYYLPRGNTLEYRRIME